MFLAKAQRARVRSESSSRARVCWLRVERAGTRIVEYFDTAFDNCRKIATVLWNLLSGSHITSDKVFKSVFAFSRQL
jgi:hypothetical protein